MEEILASIRRIISEDEAPGEAKADAGAALHAVEPDAAPNAFSVEGEDEDVLELSEPYDPNAADAADASESDFAGVDNGLDDIVAAPRAAAAYAPAPERYEPPQGYGGFADAGKLVDDRTAQTVASTFDSLGLNIHMPQQGRTLEDLVKELMYPILRDWLNQNLPVIVEAQVRAEVDRISRMRAAPR